MTKTSQFTDFADAVEAAAAGDRELLVDESVAFDRPAKVADADNLTIWTRNGNRTPVHVGAAMRDKTWLHLGTKAQDGSENVSIDSLAFLPPSGCTRSAWALRCSKIARSHIHDFSVGGNSSMTPHMGGGCIWLDGFDRIKVTVSDLYGKYTGILAHGMPDQSWGADLEIDTTTKIQNHRRTDMSDAQPGAVGIHCAGGAGGFYLNGNVIYCGVGVLIDSTMAQGAINREVFLLPGLIVDSCAEDGIRAMARSFGKIEWNGAWSASHGRGGSGSGLHVLPNQDPNAITHITGGKAWNNPNGDGVVVNGGMLFVVGLLAYNNGGYGLHVPNAAVRGAAEALFASIAPNKKGPVRNMSANFKVGSVW